MKLFLMLLFQFGWMTVALATDQEGYILNNSGDTVKGIVDVETKRVSGNKTPDLDEMEQAINFREKEGKYKRIRAAEIKGYGFIFEDTWYHFVVVDWQKNSWKKAQVPFGRKVNHLSLFLHRAYDGAVPIYKDYYRAGGVGGLNTSRIGTTYVELYILSGDLGFVELAPTKPGDKKELKEFLMKYLSLEEEFLKRVDEKAKFSQAEEILKMYNDWKKNN